MRACCGAPALRGSPPRPGSLGWRGFSWFVLRPAGSISLITSTVSPTHCTESSTESRFPGSTVWDAVPLAKREQRFRLADASEAGRGGDRRPERGGSSDAGRTLVPRGRGTAGGRTPAATRQGGGKGHCPCNHAARQGWLPNAGLGVVGGKGLRKPLPPAARRAGDQARMPGSIRQSAAKKRKRNEDTVGRRPSPYAGQHPPARARRKTERPLPHPATKNCSHRPGRPQTVASKYEH